MKKLAINLIRFYQKLISPLSKLIWPLDSCRFSPTCSEYMILTVEKHGVLKGGWLGLLRITRCNPISPGGYEKIP
ncbi:membrane protein insertion efficiency factor YidD [Patescibacteria group bacterium]|nr:membrane protein insertion efficiency factor YidD [Patescibacteria group bacterium]